jgi:hypothetical protein
MGYRVTLLVFSNVWVALQPVLSMARARGASRCLGLLYANWTSISARLTAFQTR